MEALPFPLSSRAKPRDLRFYGPVMGMFFDRVRMQVEVKVCRTYGAETMLGNRMSQPFRAGLMFGGRPLRQAQGRVYGPRSPDHLLEKHFQDGPVELQIPFDFAQGRLSFSLGGCDFLISLVVCGRKAPKSICQQASPGSFDSAP
jgi:hypothetical protein